MTPGPALVWGRAAVLGTVGLASGTVSHVLGGGHLPGVAALAVLLVISIAISACFLLSWARPRRLVLLVVAAQTGWHLVLSVLAGHAGDTAATATTATTGAVPVLPETAGRRTGTMHDAYLSSVPVPGGSPGAGHDLVSHQLDHVVGLGPLMVASHLLGAVALGLFLAVGERSLGRLLLLALARAGAALARLRSLRASAPAPLPVAFPRLGPGADVRPSQVLARCTLRRRGPPALLAA